MSGGVPRCWLYYKAYVEGGASALEHLIVDVLPEILALGGLRCWFFLRYHDAGGLHLRLRLAAEPVRAAALDVQVRERLARGLETFEPRATGRYRAAVLPRGSARAASELATRRIESERYEPETQVFGQRGVEIAERLFQASSEVALQVLADEVRGGGSRKTLAPVLMQAVLRAFPPAIGAAGFWRRYAAYWLGDQAHIERWRPRFLTKAAELKRQGVPVPARDEELPQAACEHVAAWRAALGEAAHAFAGLDEQPARRPDELASRFVHLMNNRLGLLHLEEAYFATLIESHAAEDPRCETGAPTPVPRTR